MDAFEKEREEQEIAVIRRLMKMGLSQEEEIRELLMATLQETIEEMLGNGDGDRNGTVS